MHLWYIMHVTHNMHPWCLLIRWITSYAPLNVSFVSHMSIVIHKMHFWMSHLSHMWVFCKDVKQSLCNSQENISDKCIKSNAYAPLNISFVSHVSIKDVKQSLCNSQENISDKCKKSNAHAPLNISFVSHVSIVVKQSCER